MSGDYVLILGCNTLERNVLTGMLQSEGYRVFDTDSAQAARKIARKFPVDAVLVDRGFRAYEFLAFLAHIQARHPQVARVLMTHEPQSPEALRAMGLGHAHTLLLKPITQSELLFGLARALTKARVHPKPPAQGDDLFPWVRFFNRLQPGRA